jgi:hypothetical protein
MAKDEIIKEHKEETGRESWASGVAQKLHEEEEKRPRPQ